MMAAAFIGAVVIITAFILTFAALSFYQRASTPRPETVRKLFHICMGLVSLTLPLFFSSMWMVMALSLITIAALTAVRKAKPLKQQFGNVICGVKRRSYGEIYFSIGVALTFCFADGDWLAYSIAILTLTLADAMAAIAGSRFGSLRFKLIHDQKSIEGSVTFFTVTFLCVYAPLLIFADAAWINALLIAMIISLLLTAIEAAAWRGLDNLFIPIAALLLLRSYLKASLDDLFLHLAVILLFIAAGVVSYLTITAKRIVRNA
jgi:phytol kinase